MEKDFLTWIYHRTEKPKIINHSEFESYKEQGWSDTPATFFDMESHGMDPDNELEVQAVGESIKGVKDQLNGALNLEQMDTLELREYASKHFDLKFGGRTGKVKMIQKIREEIGYGSEEPEKD